MSSRRAVVASIAMLIVAGCQSGPADSISRLAMNPTAVDVDLGPPDLNAGLEAHRVIRDRNSLVLDTRNWSTGGLPGRIVSDVIELDSGAIIALPVKITSVRLTTAGSAPAGNRLVTMVRHGPTFFQTAGWSEWQTLSAITRPNEVVVGRVGDFGSDPYLQFCVEFVSDSPKSAPSLSGMVLSYVRQSTARFDPILRVPEADIPRIVRSTIGDGFGYERPDQRDLVWLRKTCNLDGVVAGKKTEMERIVALLDWVSKRKNIRGDEATRRLGKGPYPWDLNRIFDPRDGGVVFGHCASYAELLIAALGSMGWQARHANVEGYRSCTHEVVEVWVNQMSKWVYLDPSLGTRYTSRETGEPMSLLELHDAFVSFYCEPGRTLKDYLPRVEQLDLDKGWQRRSKLDFANIPTSVHSNDYTYGEHRPWDWTDGQGVMSAGFIQLTPRNNLFSKPEPLFVRFGYNPEGVNGYPVFTDEQTPLWYDDRAAGPFPEGLTRNWFTRRRDFNWTLNQVSLRMTRIGADRIRVELGNSQPFFRQYVATVSGWGRDAKAHQPRPQAVRSPFVWTIRPGGNRLEVNCVDAFGRQGIPSRVTVCVGATAATSPNE